MKPVLPPPRASSATFLIPSSLKCLPELLGSRCQQSPSMSLGGGKLPCTTSRSMCTMSCVWGSLHLPWSGEACSIPPQQGSPLPGGVTQLPLPMPHDLPSPAMVASSKWLVRALLTLHADSPLAALPGLPGLEEALLIGSQSPGWLASCHSEVPAQLVERLSARALSASRDLHLLSLTVGVLLSLLTHKTELIVRGVYGAGKTQCIALLAAFFALRGHQVCHAARENTTIVAMATFVQELLPRAPEEAWPTAIRLLSHTQARTSESTNLDARDTDKNQQIWHAKLVLATTGLHLAQFLQPHRPLAKAVAMLTFSSMMKPNKRLPSAI